MATFVVSPIMELQDFPKKDGTTDGENRLDTDESQKSHVDYLNVNKNEDIFFDTLNVQFHIRTFLWQLCAHLFLPLFPFMVNRKGQVARDAWGLLGAFIAPSFSYIMVIAYFMLSPSARSAGMEGAFIIPLVYYLQHRLVIAIKYGSLSHTEYKRFMECEDPTLCGKYLQQVQLMSGWYQFNPYVVRFELSAASARIGSRINEIDIHIINPNKSPSALNQLRAWNAFLRGHDAIDYNSQPCKQLRPLPDGSYVVSVYDYCEALLLHSNKYRYERDLWCGRFTEFFAMVNLAIPILLMLAARRSHYSNPSDDVWIMIFVLTSTFLNIVYANVFYKLLYSAVTDVLRQKSITTNLNSMIRLTDIMLTAELSSVHKVITEKDWKETDFRVAEILSIGPSTQQTPRVGIGMEDSDRVSVVPTTHEMVSTFLPQKSPDLFKRGSVLGERIYKDNEYHLLPRISFDESNNIVAWTHARLAMQHFGSRFTFRLELYVISAMAMLVIMMAVGLLNLGMSTDRIATFSTPWFLQTLLSISMCIAFLVVIMEAGTCVNEALESHSQTMGAHSLRLARKVEKYKLQLQQCTDPNEQRQIQERIDKYVEVREQLGLMKDVVETNTQLKPYKVFGFTAQGSLTMSIMTTAASFYGVLISLICSSSSASSNVTI